MIELKNISKIYQPGKAEIRALHNVSLKVEPGEFVSIIGPSGSGKSTLLHIMGLLDRPDGGSYTLLGREVTGFKDRELALLRNHLVGFVFQQFHLLPGMTARQNAELPLIYGGRRRLKEKAREKIKEVGLSQRETHRPNELSGGEQQRVAIARSLANEPLIILADEPTGNLDSKSEEEIILLLKGLNQKGKTVVMVTHEKEIAEQTKRIISMRDGEIVSDERVEAGQRDSLMPVSISLDDILSKSHSAVGRAEFGQHLQQAIQAIVTHKMRSVLSMLGILIGVGAVIAMLALGQGARESIDERLASLGSNLLMVRPGAPRLRRVALEAGAVTRLTVQDAEAIARLPQVKRISPTVSGRAQVVYGNKNWNTRIRGVGVDYAHIRAYVPTVGRFFTEEEVRARQKVAVIGLTVTEELFGKVNPVGETIKMNRINFRVVGILPEKGATHWRDEDDLVLLPITTAMYRVTGRKYLNSINVEVKEPALIEETQASIREIIIKRHNIKEGNEHSFHIRNMTEIQEMVASTSRTMSWLLGSIAAISLLVGGIGIMNIMLVSVTERTSEIGLRKAVGAARKDIMMQFLIEAVVLTLSGGMIGVGLGAGIAVLLSVFAGWATRISLFSILLATTFSIGVGIGFGFWPARQAARLDPIEALRYE